MDPNELDPLSQLTVADPQIAESILAAWQSQAKPIPASEVAFLADQVLWGLSQEVSFGRAVATGYCDLLGSADQRSLQIYREQVQKAGQKGSTLGLLIATHLAPALQVGNDRFVQRFLATITTMLGKGTYTFKKAFGSAYHDAAQR